TPLHLGAKALNGEATVQLLLDRGAPVDALEASAGQTPLIFAASYGRTASLKLLLQHGANPEIETKVVDVLQRMVIDRAAQDALKKAAYGEDAVAADGASYSGRGGARRGGGAPARVLSPTE